MKLWFYAFAMCQSMFCAAPFPCHVWEEKARDRMLQCLPLVGLEIGFLWWVAAALSRYFAIPAPLQAVVMALMPFFLTGHIHLDGFMDVTDAVRSYRSLERRREILKDSHVGSFSVIGMITVFSVQLAAAYSIPAGRSLLPLLLIPVVTRQCAILAVMGLPPMQTSQYAARKTTAASLLIPGISLAAVITLSFFLFGLHGLCVPAAALGYGLALARGYRSLKGMNGDISGYALTLGELAGLITLSLI